MIGGCKRFPALISIVLNVYILTASAQSVEEYEDVQELINRSTTLEQTSLDSSLRVNDLALEKAIQLDSDSLIGKTLMRRSTQLIKKGENSDAGESIYKAVKHFKKTGDENLVHQAYYNLGYFHYYQKQFDSSLYYFIKVRGFFKDKENPDIMAATGTGIGTHYYYYKKDYRNALKYFKSASFAYSEIGNAEGESGNDLFTGLSYMKLGILDSAKIYLNRSYELAKKENLKGKELEALSYQASVLLQEGKHEAAFFKTEKALELAKRLQSGQQEARLTASIVGLILSDTSQIPPSYARKFVQKAGGLEAFLSYAEDHTLQYGIPHTQVNLLHYLSEHYENRGSYAKALEYHKQYKQLLDSITRKTRDETIAEIEEKYETAEREKELIQKQAELRLLTEQKQQDMERFTALIIFLLLGLGFTVVYARLKSARAREAKKEKELAEANLKKELAEKELAKQTLELKERELMAQTLTLLRKEEMLEEVQVKLEAAKSYDDMRSVKRAIQLNKLKNTDWEQFLISFNNIHPNFSKHLDQVSASTSITQRERRLAALIKLGLSNREISIMLGINSASVDQAKYRLKKKLEMEPHQKLEEYFSGIS